MTPAEQVEYVRAFARAVAPHDISEGRMYGSPDGAERGVRVRARSQDFTRELTAPLVAWLHFTPDALRELVETEMIDMGHPYTGWRVVDESLHLITQRNEMIDETWTELSAVVLTGPTEREAAE